ncbi:MAG: ergothioneine biosynthesis protein EgtB [Thermoleophilia bacterium]|nr:ergothioneine biosynthesis protein EgtB [Thermoleophilia bacterium]
MVVDNPTVHAPSTTIADRLESVRDRTLALLAPLDAEWLTRTPDPIMSPPAWDMAHIAAYEEIWLVNRLVGTCSLHPDLAVTYDAVSTPRATRGHIPIMNGEDARTYMAEVRQQALTILGTADTSEGGPELTANGFVWDMVAQHEAQHAETLLQTLQLMPRGAYSPEVGILPTPTTTADRPDPVHVNGDTLMMGATGRHGALDCEGPRHPRPVAPFRIDRMPVTIGRHLDFMTDGGYDEPRHWSPAGWAWRQRSRAHAPLHWAADGAGGWTRISFGRTEDVDPAEILCHVSFFEAEAHARWAGARLPTEAEWEMAAQPAPTATDTEWAPWGGDDHAGRANLGQVAFRPARAGAYPGGAAPTGCEHLLGDVWEWTSTPFDRYPGFRAFPYPEYAEPFFGTGYRVLRGGSWATQAIAARVTFRNWDLPDRRQIFSGLRLAWDAE